MRKSTLPLALMLHGYVACVRRCSAPKFDFDDKEVTMNRFNVLRLESIRTFLNKQIAESRNSVRGDGTG